MGLAYNRKLTAKQVDCCCPYAHSNDYGFYVSEVYNVYGYTYNTTSADASGNPAWGVYGYACPTGGADHVLLYQLILQHDLPNSVLFEATDTTPMTFNMITQAIDAGHVVVLDTLLTSAGHIILAYGYITNATDDFIIVNDPYGNAYEPSTYGKEINGAGMVYTFEMVKSSTRWYIEMSP
jgi:hypothetical protein